MSDQTSVFSEQVPATQPNDQAPQGQQQAAPAPVEPAPSASSDSLFADQLATIKNERGEPKYRDAQTALDALKHSQEYIPQLKQQNETLREELERMKAQSDQMANLEQTIERLTAQREAPEQPPAQQGFSQEQIQELLEQQLTQREQAQLAQQNTSRVSDALSQKYGEKVREVVEARAREYGMTREQLGELASRSPDAALALFDAKPKSPQGTPSAGSSVNIPPINPDNGGELEKPEKSLLQGASSREQADYMKRVKEAVYRRHGIET